MSRQSWTAEEDQAISKLVTEYGIEDWTKIAFKLRDYLGMQRRTGKQCRERWYNHLSPTVNKQPWTDEEEQLLFMHHREYGNRWKDISKLFIGRTDNDIKNHFYSTLRRSLRRLNKIVGQKNSTTQMREIKPSVLSTIMNCIYQQQQSPTQLVESLKNLPILIFEFAKFKPVKVNIKHANIQNIKEQTNQIFSLINKFNQQYQQNKQFRRSLKAQRRLKKLVLNRYHSEQPSSVKLQDYSNNSEGIPVKQEHDMLVKEEDDPERIYIKVEGDPEEKAPLSEHKNNEKTEFSLNQGHYDSYHEELTPIAMFNHMVSSPKATIKDASVVFPSHHRTFSLEADEIHDMHFNEPEEPSKMHMQEHDEFMIENEVAQQKGRTDQLDLINEVISTQFDR